MRSVLFFVSLLYCFLSHSQIKLHQGWIKTDLGKELYFEWQAPQKNRPIVVLFNGLTYSTRNWDAFANALNKKGIGVLRFDFQGHGQTLLKYGPMLQPIPYQSQVEDARSLLQKLKIPAPYNIIGLSYGGGIAQAFAHKYPQLIKNMILMAPYTRPVDSQEIYIQSQILATQMMLPFSTWTQDQLYDYYLKILVFSTFPYAEPVLLEKYKLEATYRLIQGIHKYVPEQLAPKLRPGITHLMLGAADSMVLPYVLSSFWNNVNPRSRMSRMFLAYTQHKIPELVPKFASAWVDQIVSGNPEMFKGQDFVGYPQLGYVQTMSGLKFTMEKE
jgi:pimeloyl-ACP methyl ester carboxylesterase